MDEKKKEKMEESGKLELYDWVQCIVTALVAGILIFVFAFRVVTVDGSSMKATLIDTDRIITTNLFYKPKQGDIIVFQTDTFGPNPLVKRVIATAGQTVDIDFTEGVVYVDGEALDEPYTYQPTFISENFNGKVTVPEGCLFVMGDNRNGSEDSRSSRIGFVDERCIIGKVLFIAIPGTDGDVPVMWSRVGSPYHE